MRLLELLPLAGLALAVASAQTDERLKQAGVCARCHVISVVEWSMSGHPKAGTDCVACHLTSKGHVADERNNVKPERLPRGEQIAALCATCTRPAVRRPKRPPVVSPATTCTHLSIHGRLLQPKMESSSS